MEKCFKCGIPGNKALLYDTITPKEILKICRKCSYLEKTPIIERKTEPEKEQLNARQRLSNFSKIDIRKEAKNRELEKQESYLKGVVSRNYMTSAGRSSNTDDLVENFHWIIMRVRRIKHLTQGQLAEAIHEPEVAVRMVERGLVPENNPRIIKKIEDYLNIRLKKDGFNEAKMVEKVREIPKTSGKSNLDVNKMKNLTISELQEMKKNKEANKNELLEKDSGIDIFEDKEFYDFDENEDWK